MLGLLDFGPPFPPRQRALLEIGKKGRGSCFEGEGDVVESCYDEVEGVEGDVARETLDLYVAVSRDFLALFSNNANLWPSG